MADETYYQDLDMETVRGRKAVGNETERRQTQAGSVRLMFLYHELRIGTVIRINKNNQTVEVQDGEVSKRNIPRRIYKDCRVIGNFGVDENNAYWGRKRLPKKGTKVVYGFLLGSETNPVVIGGMLVPISDKVGIDAGKDENVDEDEYFVNGKLKIRYKANGDFQIENDKAIVDVKNTGDVQVTNDNATLSVKNAGNIELNGNSKVFVTHAELDTALQNFITALNLHVHTGVTTGPGSSGTPATPMSLNITNAATTTIKTGG